MRRPHARRHRSARLRLTLVSGVCVLVAGTGLLGLTLLLAERSLTSDPVELDAAVRSRVLSELFVEPGDPAGGTTFRGLTPPGIRDLSGRAFTTAQRSLIDEALQRLRLRAWGALGATVVLALGVGWIVSGRVLRPLGELTASARLVSERTLHEGLSVKAQDQELAQLAEALDGLLARLDAAFAAQRDFVANASHELRTPLAIIRAELDVTCADPSATIDELRAMGAAIRRATERSEQLVESLLVLANAEAPALTGADVDLAGVAAAALHEGRSAVGRAALTVTSDLRPATTRGDGALLERLVGNLVENAVRHNITGGWLRVETGERDDAPFVKVSNSGRVLAQSEVGRLFERFRRLDGARAGSGGFGLGLSIVEAISRAHGGAVQARALDGGGLEVVAVFPPPGLAPAEPGVEPVAEPAAEAGLWARLPISHW